MKSIDKNYDTKIFIIGGAGFIGSEDYLSVFMDLIKGEIKSV